MLDICIIGGGAAGMTAAICAKEENPDSRILILEKKNQLGRKIAATGNGKCNLSNAACPKADETLDFFERLGVLTRTDEEGRIYPYTEEAAAVRDALEQRIHKLGIEVMTSSEVQSVEKQDCFVVELKNKTLRARKLLIACGGKAGAAFGSTGDGFRFAKKFGHRVEKPIPVLTAIEVKEDLEKLSGIRAKAAVKLFYRDEMIFTEKGEVQFTKTGISGICVFNMSRHLLLPEGASFEGGFDDYRIEIDFFPERDEMDSLLELRKAQGLTGQKVLQFLVRRPVAEMIYEGAKGDTAACARALKAFPLSPRGVRGWDFAQVTKGGVALSEVSSQTFESNQVEGLYVAGEGLDYDGPSGGFNLQHAWESGMRAGREMAK